VAQERTKNRNSEVKETKKKERKIEIVGVRETVKMVKERTENG
jgi:hypothetical protein